MEEYDIENMFRHIAMGRRNWLHSGSHNAAQNIAFMYSLQRPTNEARAEGKLA